jgi:hypothetical protein
MEGIRDARTQAAALTILAAARRRPALRERLLGRRLVRVVAEDAEELGIDVTNAERCDVRVP